jgi:hypothetical protein
MLRPIIEMLEVIGLPLHCSCAAGGVELNQPEYSGGVRQELHRLASHLQEDDIQILAGGVEDYWIRMMRSRCGGPTCWPGLPKCCGLVCGRRESVHWTSRCWNLPAPCLQVLPGALRLGLGHPPHADAPCWLRPGDHTAARVPAV